MNVKSVSYQNKAVCQQLKGFEEKLDKAQTGSLAYNPALGGYIQAFIKSYLTQSGNSEDFSKWQNSLKGYFANDFDVSKLSNMDNWKTQQLISADVVALYVQDDTKIAQIKVTYKVKTKETVEKPKHDKNDKKNQKNQKDQKKPEKPKVHETWVTKTEFYNVPYQAQDNKFTVVAMPFVSPERSSTGHISKSLIRNAKQQTNMDNSQVDSVMKFTTKFLNKYVSSSGKEMSFIMADPVGLNGAYRVKSIEDTHVSGSVSKPRISGTIMLEQLNTGVVHSEQFDLALKKQDNTYFVSKFNH
ncbi:conjugal transfer protein [Weissella viridescens]|nr:conjugal transfer protein [Weissella viridescens]